MRKILIMIAMMLFGVVAKGQKTYDVFYWDVTQLRFPCNDSTKELNKETYTSLENFIKEYNKKARNKIKFDTLIFSYPFVVKFKTQDSISATILLLNLPNKDTYMYYTIDSRELPVKYMKNGKSGKWEKCMSNSYFLSTNTKKYGCYLEGGKYLTTEFGDHLLSDVTLKSKDVNERFKNLKEDIRQKDKEIEELKSKIKELENN